jgi:hypothetical protein
VSLDLFCKQKVFIFVVSCKMLDVIFIVCIYDVWLWSITYLNCVSCSVSMQNNVEYGMFVCFIRDGGV